MAASLLSPAKVVLLAVHAASHADIETIHRLVVQHGAVLNQELLFRILLTYLPETVPPSGYVDLVRQVANDDVEYRDYSELSVDASAVHDLTDEQASKKVRKLRLVELSGQEAPTKDNDDPLTLFLYQRAYRIDEEAGMLNQLPELLVPFLSHAPAIRTWVASTVLPLSRRNFEYYAQNGTSYSLSAFQGLSDRAAVQYLLSQTGLSVDRYDVIGRDMRGLVSPWLYNDARWTLESDAETCPGWEQAMEWLVLQASKSWKVAIHAIEQWGGPRDVDFGGDDSLQLQESRLQHLDQTFVRAVLALVYLIPEPTVDALDGAHRVLSKAKFLLKGDALPLTQAAVDKLPEISSFDATTIGGLKLGPAYLRNDLLRPSNPLTEPTEKWTEFAIALVLSALVLTRLGIPCTVRRAGDLTLRRDGREQKSELVKLIRLASNNAPRNSDEYWTRVRHEVLWLHNWGDASHVPSDDAVRGIFGMLSKRDIESELLKAMLSQTRYDLVQSLYENTGDSPLPTDSVRDAVFHAALEAFDNASNPNRTRGGLRKCNDILHALPITVPKSLPTTKQTEALLSAAHSLSNYRLVLKQGEPFSPVVLRVHSDPVSIIEKVLEQNPGAYTRIQEFLEIGINMVTASFMTRDKSGKTPASAAKQDEAMTEAEQRTVAMCISAALREDDFETAYSYVVSRLGGSEEAAGEWSWKAALKAGQYIRTSKTQQPTHLGTSSGNPEIRHLEQRLECLSTAIRVAPATQLQQILESFRRCEEQLDSAITEEAAKEAAWDTAGDVGALPGAFDTPGPEKAYPPRNITASAAARQTEEAPMSLFDLSRATARVASRNLTSLSSLHSLAHGGTQPEAPVADEPEGQQRTRRRDQLREAATGTLVSGVGWLIGANVNHNREESG